MKLPNSLSLKDLHGCDPTPVTWEEIRPNFDLLVLRSSDREDLWTGIITAKEPHPSLMYFSWVVMSEDRVGDGACGYLAVSPKDFSEIHRIGVFDPVETLVKEERLKNYRERR